MAILSIPTDRSVWLKMRLEYVGASEVAALLGVQADFQDSPFTLYYVKSGQVEPPPKVDTRTKGGNAFEAAVAEMAAEEEGWTIQPGVFAVDDTIKVDVNGKIKGGSATLDRVVVATANDNAMGFSGPGAVECKFVQSDQAYKWEGGEPPIYYQIQLQDQLACSGFTWGAIVAWVGGEYVCKRYARHEGIIAAIRRAKVEFWEGVRDGQPPKLDRFDSTEQTLKLLYPREQKNSAIDLTNDNELPSLCIEHERIAKQRAAIEKREKEIKIALRAKIGANEFARIAGGITVKRGVGDDTPDRPATPGEVIKGRKGQDRLTIKLPKDIAA